MSVPLIIVTTGYDHVRDFRLGLVRAEGIEANWLSSVVTKSFRALPSIANRTSPNCRSPNSRRMTRENFDISGLHPW